VSREIGRVGEERAVAYLADRGFEIVETNFTSRYGEIDIVARRGGVLHFIEVKFSQSSDDPHWWITEKKLKRLSRTVEYYLHRRGVELPYQLDALTIWGDEIDFIENISL